MYWRNMRAKLNEIKCLDAGFVRLVDYMGGDLRSVNSARISFNKTKDSLEEKDANLIE